MTVRVSINVIVFFTSIPIHYLSVNMDAIMDVIMDVSMDVWILEWI